MLLLGHQVRILHNVLTIRPMIPVATVSASTSLTYGRCLFLTKTINKMPTRRMVFTCIHENQKPNIKLFINYSFKLAYTRTVFTARVHSISIPNLLSENSRQSNKITEMLSLLSLQTHCCVKGLAIEGVH